MDWMDRWIGWVNFLLRFPLLSVWIFTVMPCVFFFVISLFANYPLRCCSRTLVLVCGIHNRGIRPEQTRVVLRLLVLVILLGGGFGAIALAATAGGLVLDCDENTRGEDVSWVVPWKKQERDDQTNQNQIRRDQYL